MHVSDAPLTVLQPAARSFPARYDGRTVIALGAHPDDIELGIISGTVAALSRGGARVVMAVFSIPAGAAILGCEHRKVCGVEYAEGLDINRMVCA